MRCLKLWLNVHGNPARFIRDGEGERGGEGGSGTYVMLVPSAPTRNLKLSKQGPPPLTRAIDIKVVGTQMMN